MESIMIGGKQWKTGLTLVVSLSSLLQWRSVVTWLSEGKKISSLRIHSLIGIPQLPGSSFSPLSNDLQMLQLLCSAIRNKRGENPKLDAGSVTVQLVVVVHCVDDGSFIAK